MTDLEFNNSVRRLYKRNDVAAWLSHLKTFQGEDLILENWLEKGKLRIIDIGCGSGRLYEAINKLGFNYYGIDPFREQIHYFKNRFPEAQISVSDGVHLPFSDNTFDAALLAFHVIEALASEEIRLFVLKEARRVLKSQGLLIISHHQRLMYHPFLQMKHMMFQTNNSKHWGDLILRGKPKTGGITFESLWTHIPSRQELTMLANKSGFTIIRRVPMKEKMGIFRTVFSQSVVEEWKVK